MSRFNMQALQRSFKLAWPISLQNVLVTLLSMIDVIMVSHLGDAAVASVGLGNRVMFVVMIIILGLAWGVGILSAQYFGAGQKRRIRQAIIMGSAVAIVALLPIVLATFFVADDAMALGSKDSNVISLGENYLWITIPSLFFVAIIFIFENALRSLNQVKLPMVFSAIAIVLNIILNYWLINGGAGIEALGVEGAAWATTISRCFHLLLLLYILAKTKHVLYPRIKDFVVLNNKSEWFKLIKLVWPMMFSFGIWSMGTFVYQLFYGRMGTQELAVMSILTPIEGLFLSLFFGFASACSIMVGQNLGANKFDEAWVTARTFAVAAPIGAFAFGLAMLMIQDILFLPFASLPIETQDMAKNIFVIIALSAWLKVINMTLAMGMLRAGGDNQFCLFTDTLGLWVVSLPLTYYAAFHLQWPLFYVALVAYSEEICKVFLFGWRVASKKWMRNLTTKKNTTSATIQAENSEAIASKS